MNSSEILFKVPDRIWADIFVRYNVRDNLSMCMRVIRGRCDHARSHDGRGFSKLDAEVARCYLKTNMTSPWPARKWATRMLKYKGQLASVGISYPDCLFKKPVLRLAKQQWHDVPVGVDVDDLS